MTATRKYIITQLLKGGYYISYMRPNGTNGFRLFDSKANPLKNINEKTIRTLDKHIDPAKSIWKKDKHGRTTLNLSNVRKLHGKHSIKQLYKQQKASA